jgi:hypothetical protein
MGRSYGFQALPMTTKRRDEVAKDMADGRPVRGTPIESVYLSLDSDDRPDDETRREALDLLSQARRALESGDMAGPTASLLVSRLKDALRRVDAAPSGQPGAQGAARTTDEIVAELMNGSAGAPKYQ